MNYPKVSDEHFNTKIYKKFKRYEAPKKPKTFKQFCYPSEWKHQNPQMFLSKYINPSSPYKGVLVFHNIGSGKTCTAVNIGEQWKHKRNIIVVLPASLKGNFRDELRTPCAYNEYLTEKERKTLSHLHPTSVEYKKIIEQSDKRIDKYYKIYSFNKFVDLIDSKKIKLTNTLLIIDEIQNMVSEDGLYYNTLYDFIQDSPDSLRLVLLTATPMFDKPVEIALTMNLLRIPYEFDTGINFNKQFIKEKVITRGGKKTIEKEAINLDVFKERIKGYISYYRGAPPYTYPLYTIKYVKCPMSKFQYASYKKAMMKDKVRLKEAVENLSSNFLIGPRIISNIAYPNNRINNTGLSSLTNNHLKQHNIHKYSSKFDKILTKIRNAQGTVFVYSGFKEYGGILPFVKLLEANGYKNYFEHGEGSKRFATWSSNESSKQREEIKTVFNMPDNANGSKIKIMIGSPSIKEGVSLKRVQQVHVIEPYWNMSRMEQIIGRAIRYCSHKDLPIEKRQVKVYVYIAVKPSDVTNKEITVDQYIYNLAKRKNKLIKQFENAIKEVAIDCQLSYNANVYKGEEKIICDK